MQQHAVTSIDLSSFRRRITALEAGQKTTLGGCFGTIAAIAAIVGDRIGLWDTGPAVLTVCIGAGMAGGAVWALLHPHSDAAIARSVDRRIDLDDRLTTVVDLEVTASPAFAESLRAQTAPLLAEVDPSRIYPLRLTRSYAVFLALLIVCLLLYVSLESTVFLSASARSDAAQLKAAAIAVQLVSRPYLAQTDRPSASPEEKTLAHGIRNLVHDLERNRLTKQAVLIRANQLAQQALALEQNRETALSESIQSAQSAGEKLAEMTKDASIAQTRSAQSAVKAAQLQKQISDLSNKLRQGEGGVSRAQRGQDAAQLAALKQELQKIQISQQALEMMNKLGSIPAYQEAMALLSKLQQNNTSEQQGNAGMSQAQREAIADRLDQLAKELDSDSKMQAYANALLQAAKDARSGSTSGIEAAMTQAFGLTESSANLQPDTGEDGRGSTAPGLWAGDHGKLNRTDKSTLLNIKFEEHVVSSQKGKSGAQTYEEETGPPNLSGQSGVPYQVMLPRYERSAESALNKNDIPAELRSKVKDYFDSLHQQE